MNLPAGAGGATLSNGMIKTPPSSKCDAVVSDTCEAVDMMDIWGFQRPKRSLAALVGRIKAFLALTPISPRSNSRAGRPAKDNLYLGGRSQARRLTMMVMEHIYEPAILDLLGTVIEHFSRECLAGERFGDFAIRGGYAAEVKEGRYFND